MSLADTGGWLDRAGGRRADAKWLGELLTGPDATLIASWPDQCLVSCDPPVPVRLEAAPTRSTVSCSAPG
jgi:NAD+ diphosphatase